MIKIIVNPKIQIKVALTLMFAPLVLWPLSAFTIARDEPPLVLGLSWLALSFAGYAGLISALGNKAVDDK